MRNGLGTDNPGGPSCDIATRGGGGGILGGQISRVARIGVHVSIPVRQTRVSGERMRAPSALRIEAAEQGPTEFAPSK